jgi:hypothetical protein
MTAWQQGTDDTGCIEKGFCDDLSPNEVFLNILIGIINLLDFRTLHCKKRLSIFPSPAGMSLAKLSLPGKEEFG